MTNYALGIAPWYSFGASIKSLTIESGVTSISTYAFYNCSGLAGNITIPESVTNIGLCAFDGIGSTDINVDTNNVSYVSVDGILYNKALTTLIQCPAGKTAVFTSITIPSSVTEIGEHAFYNCSKLTGDLTIPAGVYSIGNYAFMSCSGLTGDLTIPASVTNIGGSGFRSCSGFTGELTLPENLNSIGDYAFMSCSGLTGEVTIPTSVTSIGNSVFQSVGLTDINVISGNANYASVNGILYNKALTTLIACPAGKIAAFTSLTIPASVTSIYAWAFSYCSGLTGDLTIPEGVTSIGTYAFFNCNKLTSAIIPDNVTTISNNAFLNTPSAFVINCHYGSVAETYAKNNSLKYNNLYDAEISGVIDGEYTGAAVTQASVVVAAKTFANPEGVEITEDEDYTVSYSDNISAGTAKMTITGMGNYNGTVSKSFKIFDVVKVVLTPDSLSKNAGYDGHIDVSFDDATAVGRQAYALAIPMLFDNDTIEITNLETVDFAAKNLTGLLVNGTFLSGARDYDASSEVLSVINSEGKFLLSWTVEEDIPLTPHTLTDDVYFRIHYRVKENVPTSASFAIGEYNIDNGIDQDQIFGVDGLGILSSNQDDFGAYLLVDGEHGILTQDYINVTVEDMPPVTISGDVNSISLQGRAMLTGKQRTAISAIGYTPNLNKIDAGIRVEMYEVDDGGDVIKQVGSVAYTQEMNMTASIGDPTSTLYNYTLNIPRTVANDLKISDPTGSSPKYMLRFSRFGDNGGSVVGTVREESYLWADIYLDGTSVNTGTIDEAIPMTVGGTAYLYAGAFYLPTAEKDALTTADLNTIKGQVGNADIAGVTTIFNINEYLGVDAADYTTVLRYVGQKKLQTLPLAVTN
jgi:hypothetical protein